MILVLAIRERCKFAASNLFCVLMNCSRRKRCCHPYDPGVMLSYMSVLIKISNHLLLILPGEQHLRIAVAFSADIRQSAAPTDTPEQVDSNSVKFAYFIAYIIFPVRRGTDIKHFAHSPFPITVHRCTAKRNYSPNIVANGQ